MWAAQGEQHSLVDEGAKFRQIDRKPGILYILWGKLYKIYIPEHTEKKYTAVQKEKERALIAERGGGGEIGPNETTEKWKLRYLPILFLTSCFFDLFSLLPEVSGTTFLSWDHLWRGSCFFCCRLVLSFPTPLKTACICSCTYMYYS